MDSGLSGLGANANESSTGEYYLILNEADGKDQAVYHATDLPSVFDTLPAAGNCVPAPTAEQLQFAKSLRGAWVAFAKRPKSGLEYYG